MSGVNGQDMAAGEVPEEGKGYGGHSYGVRDRSGGGGGDYQSGDNNSGGGGGNRGGAGGPGGVPKLDGNWVCPNPGYGNVNSARRKQCNKCGTPGDGAAAPPPGGYGASNAFAPPYSYGPPGNYSAQGGGGRGLGPLGYDSYEAGNPGGYPEPRANEPTRNDSRNVTSSSGVQPATIKECDENCGENCDNCRIYISNLPLDVTSDELRDLFGGIGQVARIKQKRGYKDQWPWSIKIYKDDAGNNKGDAVLSYEDPSAAHSAGGFYNGYMMRGQKIGVTMAQKSAPKAPAPQGGYGSGGGNRGRGGYGDRGRDGGGYGDRNRERGGYGDRDRNSHGGDTDRNRDRGSGRDRDTDRDSHGGDRDRGSGGPDRRPSGGNRSQPY